MFMNILYQESLGSLTPEGGQNFFYEGKAVANFFCTPAEGGQFFFACAKGGPEKIDERRSRIDGPPPRKK